MEPVPNRFGPLRQQRRHGAVGAAEALIALTRKPNVDHSTERQRAHARGGAQRVMHMRGPVKVHPRQPDANIVQHVTVELEMAWERAEGVSDG